MSIVLAIVSTQTDTETQKIINLPALSKIPKIHKFAIRGSEVKESFIIIWNISSCSNPLDREGTGGSSGNDIGLAFNYI